MGVLHRALYTWFVSLIFLILLALRLDEKTRWSWYIVFIPMWIFDGVMLCSLTFQVVANCTRGLDRSLRSQRPKIWIMGCVVLKLTFEIMLCVKLENPEMYYPLYYLMIPLWLLAPIILTELVAELRKIYRRV